MKIRMGTPTVVSDPPEETIEGPLELWKRFRGPRSQHGVEYTAP